jgi:galactose mutarotase-like enzyme
VRIDASFSSNADHVVLAAIPAHEAVAIEPQTHAVDGHFRAETGRPGGIATLAPGGTLSVRYRWTIRPPG